MDLPHLGTSAIRRGVGTVQIDTIDGKVTGVTAAPPVGPAAPLAAAFSRSPARPLRSSSAAQHLHGHFVPSSPRNGAALASPTAAGENGGSAVKGPRFEPRSPSFSKAAGSPSFRGGNSSNAAATARTLATAEASSSYSSAGTAPSSPMAFVSGHLQSRLVRQLGGDSSPPNVKSIASGTSFVIAEDKQQERMIPPTDCRPTDGADEALVRRWAAKHSGKLRDTLLGLLAGEHSGAGGASKGQQQQAQQSPLRSGNDRAGASADTREEASNDENKAAAADRKARQLEEEREDAIDDEFSPRRLSAASAGGAAASTLAVPDDGAEEAAAAEQYRSAAATATRRAGRLVHALRILGDNMTVYKDVFDALASGVTALAAECAEMGTAHAALRSDHAAKVKALGVRRELETMEAISEARVLRRLLREQKEVAAAVEAQRLRLVRREAEAENERLQNSKREEEIAEARRTQDALFTRFAVRNKGLEEAIEVANKEAAEARRRAEELSGTCQRYAQRVYRLEQTAAEATRQHEATVESISAALKTAKADAQWLSTSLQSLRSLKRAVDAELTDTNARLEAALASLEEARWANTPRPSFRFTEEEEANRTKAREAEEAEARRIAGNGDDDEGGNWGKPLSVEGIAAAVAKEKRRKERREAAEEKRKRREERRSKKNRNGGQNGERSDDEEDSSAADGKKRVSTAIVSSSATSSRRSTIHNDAASSTAPSTVNSSDAASSDSDEGDAASSSGSLSTSSQRAPTPPPPPMPTAARVAALYAQMDRSNNEIATLQSELDAARRALRVADVLTRSLRSAPSQGAVGQPFGPNGAPIGVVVLPAVAPPLIASPWAYLYGPSKGSTIVAARPYPLCPRDPLPVILSTAAPALQVRAWPLAEAVRRTKELFDAWAMQNARTTRTVELHTAVAAHLLDTAAMGGGGGGGVLSSVVSSSAQTTTVGLGGRGGSTNNGVGGNNNNNSGLPSTASNIPNSAAEQMYTIHFNSRIWGAHPVVGTFRAVLQEEVGVWLWAAQNRFIATHLGRLSRMAASRPFAATTSIGNLIGSVQLNSATMAPLPSRRKSEVGGGGGPLSLNNALSFADLREALEAALLADGFIDSDVEPIVRQFGRQFIPDAIIREARRTKSTVDEAAVPVAIDATPFLPFAPEIASAIAAADATEGSGAASGGRKKKKTAANTNTPLTSAGGAVAAATASASAQQQAATTASASLVPPSLVAVVEGPAVLALRALYTRRLFAFYQKMDNAVARRAAQEDAASAASSVHYGGGGSGGGNSPTRRRGQQQQSNSSEKTSFGTSRNSPQHPQALGASANNYNSYGAGGGGGGANTSSHSPQPPNSINEQQALQCLRRVCAVSSEDAASADAFFSDGTQIESAVAERFIKDVFRLCRAQHKAEHQRLRGEGAAKAEYLNNGGMAVHQMFLPGYTAHYFAHQYSSGGGGSSYPQLCTALDLVLGEPAAGRGEGGRRGAAAGRRAATRAASASANNARASSPTPSTTSGGPPPQFVPIAGDGAEQTDANTQFASVSAAAGGGEGSPSGTNYSKYASLVRHYTEAVGLSGGGRKATNSAEDAGGPLDRSNGGGGGATSNNAASYAHPAFASEDLREFVPLILFLRMYRKVPFVPLGLRTDEREADDGDC